MTFFKAQKILTTVWFTWGAVIILYVSLHIFFGEYLHVSEPVATWMGKYLCSVLLLVTGSCFFSHSHFTPELRDKIYYRLAIWSTVTYLLLLTLVIIILPRRATCDKECFLKLLSDSGLIFNVLGPVLSAILGYFFYKSRKKESGNAPDPA